MPHDEILSQLIQLNLKIDGKNIPVIKTSYWELTAVIQVDGEISSFKKKMKCVKQRFVLSPDLFSLSHHKIMPTQEEYSEIKGKQIEIC